MNWISREIAWRRLRRAVMRPRIKLDLNQGGIVKEFFLVILAIIAAFGVADIVMILIERVE